MNFMNTATGGFQRLLVSAGNANQGAFAIELYNLPDYDAWLIHWNETTETYDKTYLPDAVDWSAGYVWHTLTVEMNFATHEARAKLNDKDFTAWVHMPEEDSFFYSGSAYDYTSINVNASQGTFNLDNLWLTQAEYDCAEAIADGYGLDLDFNDDCSINLVDFASLAGDWLDCMEPGVGGCQTPWSP